MLMIRIHFQCMGFLCCVFIMNCVVTGQTYFHKIQCMQLVNLEVPYVKNVFPLETCGGTVLDMYARRETHGKRKLSTVA